MAFSAARGSALIGLAIVIGLVLLQVVDSSDGAASNGGITVAPEPTTELTPPDDGAPADGNDAVPPVQTRAPEEIRVMVLNGADPDEPLAGTLTEELRVAGYQTLPPDDTEPRAGTAVSCKADFADDAPALAVAAGETAVVEPFPEVPPQNAEDVASYDCLVVLGS